jgi:hypothetical protein
MNGFSIPIWARLLAADPDRSITETQAAVPLKALQ